MQIFQGYNRRLMQMAQCSPLFVISSVKQQETFGKMNSVKKQNTVFPIFFILHVLILGDMIKIKQSQTNYILERSITQE